MSLIASSLGVSARIPVNQQEPLRVRSVLHVGCGPRDTRRLHPVFRDLKRWREVRLDIDPAVAPDVICSTVDMREHVGSGVFDAAWSSHNIEHLYDHEVLPALREMLRVLRPSGYLLIRCPDLEAVVEAIARDGLESVAYQSPAGPITPLDMLFGHRPSVAAGNEFMAHRTAFTDLRLGRLLLEAGFSSAMTLRAAGFDLWAVAFAAQADVRSGLNELAAAGLRFEE